MDHVAILRKSNIEQGDDLLGDILSGKKTIESRWYVNKVAPWGRIHAGDVVYFKESGCPVIAVAKVSKVLQFEGLNEGIFRKIVDEYGEQIAPGLPPQSWMEWFANNENKRYCILIFLRDVKKVFPFEIDKTGFGISSAWMCVGDIKKVKR